MGYTHANYLRPGVFAPNPYAPRATANRSATLKGGAWSTRCGYRVGVADSFEGGFVWGLVRSNRCHPKRIASKLAI